jgi:hypothetical protein
MKYANSQVCLTTIGRSLKVLSICLGIAACSDDAIIPPANQPQYGLTGVVVDSSGRKLDSVSIFCLYNSYYVPLGSAGGGIMNRVSGVDTFGFRLYQNFPNPFSHSTFIRFSLPRACAIVLTVHDNVDGSTKYSYVDDLQGGLYQIYLHRLVDSLRLRNGPYRYVLEAVAAGDDRYLSTESMFVLSDSGKPSSETNEGGVYFLDYKYAFVGDSLMRTTDGDNIHPIYLSNDVNLLVRRPGYRPELITASLFPTLLIQRDIVLVKEDG